MNKTTLRKEMLSKLKVLPDREEKSRAVSDRFLSLPRLQSATDIALFFSTDTEPDTLPIITALILEGKKVYAPRVQGEEMYFVQVTDMDNTAIGAFGIREPVGERYDGYFDVMAVPLVAFDEYNYRLGHGKGYYDKYLAVHSCYTVGLAFSCQKEKKVPTDRWDLPLDMIITD